MTKTKHSATYITMRIFFVLGIIATLIAIVSLFSNPMAGIIVAIIAAFYFATAALVRKKNIVGIYLAWIFVAIGLINIIINPPTSEVESLGTFFLTIILMLYIASYVYKAQKELKSPAFENIE